MKAVVALLLSFVMFVGGLMPYNDVEELSKLPYLVQHFQYHRTGQGGSLTVGQFLRMRYGGGTEPWVAGTPEHDRLPFLGEHHFPNLEYIVPTAELVMPVKALTRLLRAYQLARPPDYCFAFYGKLLQPPRA